MDIRVSKLKETMELLKPVVPKKPALKTASYICLGNGKIIGTDMETMLIVNVPQAREQMLLPFAAVYEMLKYVPGPELIHIELKGRVVYLTWDGGSASYPTEDFASFPELPEMQIRADSLIDGDTLVAAMTAALPYVAESVKGSPSKPVLEGETIILGSPVEVAAGDGFRMTHQALGLTFPLEEKIIIPAHSVAVLEHVFKKTPRNPGNTDTLVQAITAKRMLRMSLLGENKLRLDLGTSATIVCNLIAGDPPKWLALVPTGDPIMQSQIFALHFEAAVKRVRDIAKEGSGVVRLEFIADGKLKVSAIAKDQEISSTIDTMITQGEPKRVGINQSYLLDYLNGKQGIITLSIYTEGGPVVFEYSRSPRVLIMPMSVQWDGEPPAEEPKSEASAEANSDAEDESDDSTGEETTEPEEAPVEE